MGSVVARLSLELDQLDVPSSRSGGASVVAAQPHRHRLIVHAVDQQHRHRERNLRQRVRQRIALGHLDRGSPE